MSGIGGVLLGVGAVEAGGGVGTDAAVGDGVAGAAMAGWMVSVGVTFGGARPAAPFFGG